MNGKEYRERLIDEVKKYPVLYDTRHENTRDIDVRDRCWLEISERLGVDSDVLKREWKILRDSLRQALKSSAKGTSKKWRFQSRMAFVLPYMRARRTQRVSKGDSKFEETDAQLEVEHKEDIREPDDANQDSLELFFASVCQSTKRLPRRFQNQIKKQVLDILLKADEDCENEIRQSETGLY